MIAAIYVRVSTQDQAKYGYSLSDQLVTCRQRLLNEGFTNIVEYREEGNSGEWLDRPTLQRLRDDVAKGLVSTIIMYDPDRMSRDLPNQLILDREFNQSGIRLMFVTGDYDASPEGKLFFQMKGAVSSYELGKIRERTMRGKRRKASEGRIIQDFGLYGYDYDIKKQTYIINEEEAKVIREIYRLAAEQHMSVQYIQRELKTKVIASPTGKPFWPVSTIYNILTNETYIGKYFSMKNRYTKTGIKTKMKTPRPESDWIQILVPSIIDKPTFDFVQQQLKDNRAITKKTMSHPFLLSGLLYCGICGQKMTVHHSIFRNGRYMPYYVCASQRYHNLRNAGLSCKARSLPAVAIDNDIWEILQKINLDPLKLENYLPEMQKENMNESNQLLKMESALITQRETILIWYRKKKISDEQAEKQLDEIGQQLAAIAARIKNISPVNVVSSQSPTALSYKIKALFESNALSDDIKKRLLRGMFKKIIAARTDGHKGRRQIPVFRIALEFFS